MTEQYWHGNTGPHVRYTSPNEFGTTVPTFDAMAKTIRNDVSEPVQTQAAAQGALAAAQRFRDALDHVHAYICMKDTQSRYIYANRPMLTLFGCSAEELKGADDARFFPAATVARLQEVDARVFRGEETMEEIDVADARGGRRVYLECKSPIFVEPECRTINGLLGISVDITERRKAADAKIRRLSRLYAALAHCNAAVARCKSETELFQQTCRNAVVLGGLKMAWVGMSDADHQKVTPVASFGDDGGYLNDVTILLRSDQPLGRGPTALAMRDNHPVWCQDFLNDPCTGPWHERGARAGWRSSAALPLSRGGIVVGALTLYAADADAFDEDIRRLLGDLAANLSFALDNLARDAARKEAGEALKESEIRFRTMFEEAPLGVALIDSHTGHIIEVNRRFAEIAGRTRAEMSTIDWMSITHPDDVRTDLDNMAKMNAGEIVGFSMVKRYRRPDDSYVWINMTVAPMTVGEATHSSHLCMVEDITQRKALEDQLRHAQKMDSIGRLASGVAHDFNNMLAVILMQTELLLLQADGPSPDSAGLLQIQAAAERSADLTKQLLTFARKQATVPRVLDLNTAVANSLKMLERLIGENIKLSRHLAEGLWPIFMDPTHLDQILANLCVNARDAIAGIGTLSITTANRVLDDAFCVTHADATRGDFVQLTVTDDGCGMTREVLEHIFEPFFTTKRIGEGTGLGLATVYGAVRQASGFLVVSSAPHQGTTFDIYLPRYVGIGEPVIGSGAKAPVERGHETILLVEDEQTVLGTTTAALQELGYGILGATSPSEAIRIAGGHTGRIDLLLTDVTLPEMNGRDLANTLATRHPDLKVLMMSGLPANVISAQGALDDKTPFLEKPFALATLAGKVREVLDGAAEGRR